MDIPPISKALSELNIPHRVFRHVNQVTSLEQAAEERGQRASQVVRSILFRVSEDDFVMALVAGPDQISWKTLRKYLGKSRISMATEEEVLEVTGYKVGTVGPFAMKKNIRMLVESRLLEEEEISIGSGMSNTTVILKSANLMKALNNPDVVSLIQEEF